MYKKLEENFDPKILVKTQNLDKDDDPEIVAERARLKKLSRAASYLVILSCLFFTVTTVLFMFDGLNCNFGLNWTTYDVDFIRLDFTVDNVYAPEQLHMSLGQNDSERYITWSTIRPVNQTVLEYREINNESYMYQSGKRSLTRISTKTDVDSSWTRKHRTLYTYRAKMVGLVSGLTYTYRIKTVDPDGWTLYSKEYIFKMRSMADSNAAYSIALYGDLGLKNAQSVPRLSQHVDESRYDLIIHNGDFAYDLNTDLGRYGDEFMRLIEPIAARVPYQTSVGNHEVAENFTHYDSRFTMVNSAGPDKGRLNNYYYSFNTGPIHFVVISTEFYYFVDYSGVTPLHNQYEWLKKDLEQANTPDERAKRPWIILLGHRPMYCSSRDKDDCTKSTNILRKGFPFFGNYALEKMLYNYGVDLLFWSHEHLYERFLPIYDGKVMNGTDDPSNPYHNPRAPVHLISGAAGCQEMVDLPDKATTGSIKQINDYGFTTLRASRCELRFNQVSDDKGAIVDQFVLTKTKQTFPATAENIKCV